MSPSFVGLIPRRNQRQHQLHSKDWRDFLSGSTQAPSAFGRNATTLMVYLRYSKRKISYPRWFLRNLV